MSSAADHYAEVSSAVPGTYFIRVAGDAATRYDLAVWLFDPTAQDPSFDIDLRFLGTHRAPGRQGRFERRRQSGRASLPRPAAQEHSRVR